MNQTSEENDTQEQELLDPLLEERKKQFKIFSLVGDGFNEDLEPESEDDSGASPVKEEEGEAATEPGSSEPASQPLEGEEGDSKTEDADEPKPPAVPKVTIRKKEQRLPDIQPFTPEKKTVDPTTAFQEQQQQQPPPAPAEPTDLMDDEREELELARFAEAEKPGSYQSALDFILKRREFIKQRIADEGRGYRPSQDPEYREWVEENAPLKPAQRKQLERRKIQDELRKEFEQANQKRDEALRREIEALRKKPEIEKKSSQFRQAAESSLSTAFKEVFPEIDDADQAAEAIRPIIAPVVDQYSGVVESFLELNGGIVPFNQHDPTHNFISRFIDEQARFFEAHGGTSLFRDGRRFVRPDLISQVPKEQQHLYWTFSESDIVDVFAEKSRMETRRILENEKKKWEKFQKIAPKRKKEDGKRVPSGERAPLVSPPSSEDLGPSAETSLSPGASGGSEQEASSPSFLSFLNG